jgi:hypothetical protein
MSGEEKRKKKEREREREREERERWIEMLMESWKEGGGYGTEKRLTDRLTDRHRHIDRDTDT